MRPLDSRLLGLVSRWEEKGRPDGLDEVCSDCPELKDALAERIGAILRAEKVPGWSSATLAVGEGGGAAGGGPAIEGFEVRGVLGHGGMGVVYRAFNTTTRREVAVKVVHPGLTSSASLRERFRREIEITARLEHPAIARVYSAGEFEHEGVRRAYLEMELVPGVPLDDASAAYGWDLRRKVEAVESVCQGVAAAHAALIVHRDLKPSNILADEAGGGWGVRVLDFGLAKALEDEAGAITLEEAVGTAYYMSPEQAKGERVGTPTDVWALGVVLYGLALGRLPHDKGTGRAAYLRAVTTSPVTRPRAVDARFPRDLEAVLLKALEIDPGRRYRSADALAEDLRRWLEGRPVSARPHTPAYVAVRHVGRNRFRYAAAAGVLAVLGSTGAWMVANVVKERDATRAALVRLEQTAREREAARAEAVLKGQQFEERAKAAEYASSFTFDMLSTMSQRRPDGSEATVRQMLSWVEATLPDRMQEWPWAWGVWESGLAKAWLHYDVRQALRLAEQSISRLTPVLGAGHVEVLNSRTMRARVLSNLGEWRAAEAEFDRLLADVERLYPQRELPHVAWSVEFECRRNLASITSNQRRWEEARSHVDWLLANYRRNPILARNSGDRFEGSAETLAGMLGDASAIERLKGRIEKVLRSMSNDRTFTISMELNLGCMLVAQGRFDEGEAVLLSNLELRRRQFGPTSNLVSLPLEALADSSMRQGKWDEAAERYRQVLAQQAASLGVTGGVARAQRALHEVFLKASRPDDAGRVLAEVQAAAEKMLTGAEPVSAEALLIWGELMESAGQGDASRLWAESGLKRSGWPEDDPRAVVLRDRLSR